MAGGKKKKGARPRRRAGNHQAKMNALTAIKKWIEKYATEQLGKWSHKNNSKERAFQVALAKKIIDYSGNSILTLAEKSRFLQILARTISQTGSDLKEKLQSRALKEIKEVPKERRNITEDYADLLSKPADDAVSRVLNTFLEEIIRTHFYRENPNDPSNANLIDVAIEIVDQVISALEVDSTKNNSKADNIVVNKEHKSDNLKENESDIKFWKKLHDFANPPGKKGESKSLPLKEKIKDYENRKQLILIHKKLILFKDLGKKIENFETVVERKEGTLSPGSRVKRIEGMRRSWKMIRTVVEMTRATILSGKADARLPGSLDKAKESFDKVSDELDKFKEADRLDTQLFEIFNRYCQYKKTEENLKKIYSDIQIIGDVKNDSVNEYKKKREKLLTSGDKEKDDKEFKELVNWASSSTSSEEKMPENFRFLLATLDEKDAHHNKYKANASFILGQLDKKLLWYVAKFNDPIKNNNIENLKKLYQPFCNILSIYIRVVQNLSRNLGNIKLSIITTFPDLVELYRERLGKFSQFSTSISDAIKLDERFMEVAKNRFQHFKELEKLDKERAQEVQAVFKSQRLSLVEGDSHKIDKSDEEDDHKLEIKEKDQPPSLGQLPPSFQPQQKNEDNDNEQSIEDKKESKINLSDTGETKTPQAIIDHPSAIEEKEKKEKEELDHSFSSSSTRYLGRSIINSNSLLGKPKEVTELEHNDQKEYIAVSIKQDIFSVKCELTYVVAQALYDYLKSFQNSEVDIRQIANKAFEDMPGMGEFIILELENGRVKKVDLDYEALEMINVVAWIEKTANFLWRNHKSHPVFNQITKIVQERGYVLSSNQKDGDNILRKNNQLVQDSDNRMDDSSYNDISEVNFEAKFKESYDNLSPENRSKYNSYSGGLQTLFRTFLEDDTDRAYLQSLNPKYAAIVQRILSGKFFIDPNIFSNEFSSKLKEEAKSNPSSSANKIVYKDILDHINEIARNLATRNIQKKGKIWLDKLESTACHSLFTMFSTGSLIDKRTFESVQGKIKNIRKKSIYLSNAIVKAIASYLDDKPGMFSTGWSKALINKFNEACGGLFIISDDNVEPAVDRVREIQLEKWLEQQKVGKVSEAFSEERMQACRIAVGIEEYLNKNNWSEGSLFKVKSLQGSLKTSGCEFFDIYTDEKQSDKNQVVCRPSGFISDKWLEVQNNSDYQEIFSEINDLNSLQNEGCFEESTNLIKVELVRRIRDPIKKKQIILAGILKIMEVSDSKQEVLMLALKKYELTPQDLLVHADDLINYFNLQMKKIYSACRPSFIGSVSEEAKALKSFLERRINIYNANVTRASGGSHKQQAEYLFFGYKDGCAYVAEGNELAKEFPPLDAKNDKENLGEMKRADKNCKEPILEVKVKKSTSAIPSIRSLAQWLQEKRQSTPQQSQLMTEDEPSQEEVLLILEKLRPIPFESFEQEIKQQNEQVSEISEQVQEILEQYKKLNDLVVKQGDRIKLILRNIESAKDQALISEKELADALRISAFFGKPLDWGINKVGNTLGKKLLVSSAMQGLGLAALAVMGTAIPPIGIAMVVGTAVAGLATLAFANADKIEELLGDKFFEKLDNMGEALGEFYQTTKSKPPSPTGSKLEYEKLYEFVCAGLSIDGPKLNLSGEDESKATKESLDGLVRSFKESKHLGEVELNNPNAIEKAIHSFTEKNGEFNKGFVNLYMQNHRRALTSWGEKPSGDSQRLIAFSIILLAKVQQPTNTGEKLEKVNLRDPKLKTFFEKYIKNSMEAVYFNLSPHKEA